MRFEGCNERGVPMKNERYITTPQAAALAGIEATNLRNFAGRFGCRPARRGHPGENQGHKWTPQQVWALMVAKALRRFWVDPLCVADVLDYLLRLPREQMEAALVGGRRFLLIVGKKCLPRLLCGEAVFGPEIDREAAAALGVRTEVLDTGLLWQRVLNAIAALPEGEREGAAK